MFKGFNTDRPLNVCVRPPFCTVIVNETPLKLETELIIFWTVNVTVCTLTLLQKLLCTTTGVPEFGTVGVMNGGGVDIVLDLLQENGLNCSIAAHPASCLSPWGYEGS